MIATVSPSFLIDRKRQWRANIFADHRRDSRGARCGKPWKVVCILLKKH
jgi:hypothetical protein